MFPEVTEAASEGRASLEDNPNSPLALCRMKSVPGASGQTWGVCGGREVYKALSVEVRENKDEGKAEIKIGCWERERRGRVKGDMEECKKEGRKK